MLEITVFFCLNPEYGLDRQTKILNDIRLYPQTQSVHRLIPDATDMALLAECFAIVKAADELSKLLDQLERLYPTHVSDIEVHATLSEPKKQGVRQELRQLLIRHGVPSRAIESDRELLEQVQSVIGGRIYE